MSPELRWLASYVALSRPRSLSQLISVSMLDNLREVIEGGPHEGIFTKFNEMFKDTEIMTHLMAEKVLQELVWKAAQICLFAQMSRRCHWFATGYVDVDAVLQSKRESMDIRCCLSVVRRCLVRICEMPRSVVCYRAASDIHALAHMWCF